MEFIDRIYNPPEPKSLHGNEGNDGEGCKPLKGVELFFHLVRTHEGALVKISLLFIVSCLPIVTIPVAWYALTSMLVRMTDRRMFFVWQDWWDAWRSGWRRAYAVMMPYCLLMCVAVGACHFYLGQASPLGSVLSGVCLVVLLLGCMAGPYVCSMTVRTCLAATAVWRNAGLLVPLRLKSNLVVLVFDMLVLAVGLLLLPWTLFVLPLFGMSVMGLAGEVTAKEGLADYVVQ